MSGADAPQVVRLSIPLGHGCFADHFPGAPLVPGALLLKWIMGLLAEAGAGQIHYLKQVKFLAPVQPGDDLRICITPATGAPALAVAAYKGELLVLKGQFERAYD